VTDVEKSILQQQGVSSVEVVSNIHLSRITDDRSLDTSFAARKDILFIGSYNHPPNVDGVLWLCREIMPLVWEKLPEIKVTLLGSNPTAQVQSLASDRVEVTGYVADVSDYFLSHRIFVSPLRYGAGMKGKIGQSLEYALPIISTEVGIEGMHLTTGKNILEANDTAAFAQAILRLYQTEDLWNNLASNASEAINIFTPEVIKQNLVQIMKKFLVQV